MNTLLLFLSSFLPLVSSGNTTADLYGSLDTKEGSYGYADSASWKIQFYAPSGQRVRILRLEGDFSGMPKHVVPGITPGTYAGVLVGFQTTAPDGGLHCNLCADNTPMYRQAFVADGQAFNSPFDYKYSPGFLLEPDGILIVKVASFLNTTGVPIHVEPTYTISYVFERIP